MKIPSSCFLLLTCFFLHSCGKSSSDKPDETARMVSRLDSIAQHVNPGLNEYASSARVAQLKQMPVTGTRADRMVYSGTLAQEMIYAGDTQEAIELLESMLEEIEEPGNENLQARFTEDVLDLLALAWLRLGEQQNCVTNHSAESCLFPIRGEGLHTLTEGSEKAIEYYERLLTEWRPDDMESRWLLNVAYMTLGKHPDEVPEQWLIPAELFEEAHNFPRFQDIAPFVGLAGEMTLSGGSVTEDFNNNGFIDIMASSWGLSDQIHYYENSGDGRFIKKTDAAGLTGITGGLNLVHADYNNDGYADVFVLRGAWLGKAGHHPNSLLRNNGDGTFSDVTESAGLLSFHPTQTAVWADFNNDGWIDLFIGNESVPDDPHPAEFYLNNQDGTFRNAANQAGVGVDTFIKGVTAGDMNNDGLTDLYISVLEGPNILFMNQGPDSRGVPSFKNITTQTDVEQPYTSFPAWFWDYNNDGWLDLFVSGYYATSGDVAREYLGMSTDAIMPVLYRNDGISEEETQIPAFTNETKETGLYKVMYTMGSNFGDLDNDGHLDFYVGTGDPGIRAIMPNRMFRNVNGSRFEEVTTSGGFGHLQKGHGVSFADLNNNGQQDIFTVIGGALEGDSYMNALFENPGNNNHWVVLIFRGQQSNRFGIGNRVKVTVEEAGSVRTIHRSVTTGGSFGSSSLQLEIGLEKADRIIGLDVYWPASGTTQHFADISVNRYYRITEFSDDPELLNRRTFQFSSPSPPAR